jgi:hypothetical protein
MMPSFLSIHNALIGACVVLLLGLALDSVVLIAIIKKKHVRASGWCNSFGFEIEVDD